jgi:hypothetical protein
MRHSILRDRAPEELDHALLPANAIECQHAHDAISKIPS